MQHRGAFEPENELKPFVQITNTSEPRSHRSVKVGRGWWF